MNDAVEISFGGETLWLLPDKAALLPASGTLLVADTHFGKGEVFRQNGIAVPTGSTATSMRRIEQLLARFPADNLVVLGDFLHGKPSPELITKIAEWSAALPARLVVLRGNHDRHLIQQPASWQHIEMQTEVKQAGITLQHEPVLEAAGDTAELTGSVMCGHIHPVASVGTGRRDRLTMPVFWHQRGQQGEQLVLPSFGSFTGGFRIKPDGRSRLYAAGEDAVIAL